MRRIALTCAFVLASVLPAFAADTPPLLTLDQALMRVRSAGFDIRMARADAATARADAGVAGAALRPQVGITANYLAGNEPQLGLPIARQAYGAATLSIPLFTPSNALAARSAAETARAAESMVDASTNDAVFAAIAAYRRIQLADAIVFSRAAALNDQAAQLHLTEQRVAVGKSARFAALRSRATVATAQQALEDARSERDQAAFDLAAVLDLDRSDFSVDSLARIPFAEKRGEVLDRALARRPGILAAEQRITALQSSIAAARAAYTPSGTLTAQTYNGRSVPNLGANGGQLQLTFALPILDGSARRSTRSKAQAEFDKAIAARDQIRATTKRDVADAWRELEAATRNISTATAGQVDAEEQLRLSFLRRQAGKGIETETLDALALTASAREAVVRSLARYDNAVSAVQHAAGDFTKYTPTQGDRPR